MKFCALLKRNHFKTTGQSIRRYIIRFETNGSVLDHRKPKSDCFRKINHVHLQYVNMWMSRNPEMTAQSVLERLEKQCRVKVTKEYLCALRRLELVIKGNEVWPADLKQEREAQT